jgi:hypothetical protein
VNPTWLILLLLDVFFAYLIANYQRSNGYSFKKSFIGALIGLIGLTLLTMQAMAD